MGHGLGSFIAVLLAVAVCIAAYKVIRRNLNKPRHDPVSGGGSGQH